MDTALARFGRIDILVSNAGIDCESPVVDLEIEDLDRCLAVNVRGPFLLCKFALPSMISAGIATGSGQNPSLTYMALTARAADYAVQGVTRGELRLA